MFQSCTNRARIRIAGAVLASSVSIFLLLGGCTKNYGSFSLDDQVRQDFRSGTVRPDLDYYYAGRDTMPYAIIGLDPSYSVPEKHWIPFAPQAEQLRNMSGNIYGKDQYNSYGARIMDPAGKVIGIWYSNVADHTVKMDPDKRTVHLLFKNPELTNGGRTSSSSRP